MEKFPETDYCKIGTIISELANTTVQHMVGSEKPVVKMLLSVAKSDRKRECLQYTSYKALGMSPTMVRRKFGFENMQARAISVESALLEIRII